MQRTSYVMFDWKHIVKQRKAGATYKQISDEYGMSMDTAQKYIGKILGGEHVWQRAGAIRKEFVIVPTQARTTTLCWKCQRASGRLMKDCPWASRFEPVPGWDAEATITNSYRPVSSYHVKRCPLFMRDKPRL